MFGPPTVLVVDDEPDVGESVRDILKTLKYEVLTATSPEEGLGILMDMKEMPIDLLFVDFRMPRMDGIRFIERARELRPGVPAILFTAHADLDVVVRAARDVHVAKFLRKPIDAPVLRAVVKEVAGAHWHARQRDAAFDRSKAKAQRDG